MAARRTLLYWSVALAAACALIQLHPVGDPDTFWHLTLGRAVLANRARLFPEPVALAAFARPCVAPEWLWEVITYCIYNVGGYRALSIFLSFAAALSAAAVALFVARRDRDSDGKSFAPVIVVSTAVMLVVLSRIILRPQTACLILLPLFLVLLDEYARAEGRPRALRGAALVAAAAIWAQLHGSFILAPALFFILICTRRRELGGGAAARRTHLLVGLGLAGALLTSAYGASVFVYIIQHAGGDSVRHIEDMRAPAWATITPAAPYGAAWLALLAASLVGLAAARGKPTWYEAALAAFGLILFLTANRFIDVSAILMAPLALRGVRAACEALPKWRVLKYAAPAGAAAALFWFGHAAREWWGPAGVAAASESKLPAAAAAALRALPGGQNVMSSYEGAGPLGFWLAGHSRTFVDGRTPLFFDDTDYAVARDIWFRPRALAAGLERYGITAIVAPRDSLLCRRAAERWAPISVEYGFTTFVPKTGAPEISRLAACGDEFLARDACADGGAAVQAEIGRLESIHPSPFYSLLRAEALARCGRPASELDAALPARAAAWDYERWWRRLRARVLVADHRAVEALALVEAQISDGDLAALNAIFPAVLDGAPLARVRRAFDRLMENLDDDAPSDLRVSLALLCIAQSDADCARFQAVRAAADGNRRAAEPLRWLQQNHPSESARIDAGAWLKTIQNK